MTARQSRERFQDCRCSSVWFPIKIAVMKSFMLVAAFFAVSLATVFSQEDTYIFFPNDNPIIELNFPEGFKAAHRKDGTCLAVGPKTVMALAAMDKVKTAAAAKTALPDFAKSFVTRSLNFRELKPAGVQNANLPRAYTDGEAIATETLTTSGTNSDGAEMFVNVTAFPWGHHYFVLFTIAKPADKEQAEKERRSALETVTDVNND